MTQLRQDVREWIELVGFPPFAFALFRASCRRCGLGVTSFTKSPVVFFRKVHTGCDGDGIVY
jgi:hypothetical protein